MARRHFTIKGPKKQNVSFVLRPIASALVFLLFLGVSVPLFPVRANEINDSNFASNKENSLPGTPRATQASPSVSSSTESPETPSEPISSTTEGIEGLQQEEPESDSTSLKQNLEEPSFESLQSTTTEPDPVAPQFKLPSQPKTTVDQNTGALVYDYDIELPEGRAGLTPEVTLSYNSNNLSKFDTVSGLGWDLSTTYIKREPLYGSDQMYSKHFFSSTLSGLLVATTNNQANPYVSYIAENDDGSYLQYKFNSDNSWTVKNKEGLTYIFGSSSQARQINPNNASQTYKWMLSSVVDVNGNSIQYTYSTDSNQLYLEAITYTHHQSAPAVYEVDFVYNLRAEVGATYYNAGFPITTQKILDRIVVYTRIDGAEGVHTYRFSYTNSQFVNQKNLIIIEEDRQFPVVEYYEPGQLRTDFTYTTKQPGWQATTYNLQSYLPEHLNMHRHFQHADFNNDGLEDVLSAKNINNIRTNYLLLNNGSNFVDVTASWSLPTHDIQPHHALVDLNGDHFPDFHPRWSKDQPYSRTVFVNTGSGFVADNSGLWVMENYVPEATCGPNIQDKESSGVNTFLYDINYDGKNDIVYFGGTAPEKFKVFINNGSGWVQSNSYVFTPAAGASFSINPVCGGLINDNYQTLIDFNNDGRLDYYHAKHGVYLNTGTGFKYNSAYSVGLYDRDRSLLIDLNGDSLIDLTAVQEMPNNQRCNFIYINNGSGLQRISPVSNQSCEYSSYWDVGILKLDDIYKYRIGSAVDITGDGFPDVLGPYLSSNYGSIKAISNGNNSWVNKDYPEWGTVGHPSYSQYFDINGDGLVDFIQPWISNFNTNPSGVFIAKSGSPNRLETVKNNFGAVTRIEYGTAKTNLSDTSSLVVPVVKKVSVENIGMNQPNIATTYEYGGADYYADPLTGQRSFAGFQKMVIKEMGLDSQPIRITETYYHQGNGQDALTYEPVDSKYLIGRPYYTVVKNNQGVVFKEIWNKYSVFTRLTEAGTSRQARFVSILNEIERTLNTNVAVGQAVSYVYDNVLGEPVQVKNHGLVNVGLGGVFTDISGDSRFEYLTYAANSDKSLVKLARKEMRSGTSGSSAVTRTDYYYDNQSYGVMGAKGLTTKEVVWVTLSPQALSSKVYTYNIYGNPTTIIDPLGAVTTFDYDQTQSWLVRKSNHLGHITTFQYSLGRLVDIIEPNGRVTSYTYTKWGFLYATRLQTNTGVQKTTVVFERDNNYWQILTRTIPNNNVQHTENKFVDNLGREVRTIRYWVNEDGLTYKGYYVRQSNQYDELGRVVRVSAPYEVSNSGSTLYAFVTAPIPDRLMTNTLYDVLDRPLLVDNVLGVTRHDYIGQEILTTNPRGKKKSVKYNAYGEVLQVKEYIGTKINTTTYVYNAAGSLTKVTDAAKNIRNFKYNNAGWVVSAEDAHTSKDLTFGLHLYEYDLAGNVIKHTQPDGNQIINAYDQLGRLITVDSLNTSGVDYQYTYDSCVKGLGLVCKVEGFANTTTPYSKTYAYGVNGQPATYNLAIDGANYNTTYKYNHSNELTEVIYPNGTKLRVVMGDWAKPAKLYLTLPGQNEGLFASIEYNHFEAPVKITYSNGIVTTHTYNELALHRKSSTVSTKNGSTVSRYDYVYDPVGNITKITELGLVKQYTYDDLDRLTQAVYTPTQGTSTTYKYEYNAIGNITKFNGQAYLYSAVNKTNPHAVTSVGTDLYTYDDNGNMTSAPNQTFVNNWQNKPTQVVIGGVVNIHSSYDESGERLVYQTPANREVQVANDYLLRNNVPEIGLNLGGVQLGVAVGGLVYTSVVDHLSSPAKQLDSSGAVVEDVSYDPYGKVLLQSGSVNIKRGYTGHEEDVDTGLVYAEARYYNPVIGRFTSQDPAFVQLNRLDAQLLDPQSWNSYAYARNNPIKYTDPDGEWFWEAADALQVAFSASRAMQNVGNYLGDRATMGVGKAIGSTRLQTVAANNLKSSAPAAISSSKSLATDAALAVLPVPLASVKGTAKIVQNSDDISRFSKFTQDTINHAHPKHAVKRLEWGSPPPTKVELGNKIENVLKNFDVKTRIRGYQNGLPINKTYYGLAKTNEVVIKNSLGKPTIFTNKNPYSYIKRRTLIDRKLFGVRR